MRTIPMFFGYKTETDNEDLANFVEMLVGSRKEDGEMMMLDFDSKFPGIREATARACKDLAARQLRPTLLEIVDGRVRARNTSIAMSSAWYTAGVPVEGIPE